MLVFLYSICFKLVVQIEFYLGGELRMGYFVVRGCGGVRTGYATWLIGDVRDRDTQGYVNGGARIRQNGNFRNFQQLFFKKNFNLHN